MSTETHVLLREAAIRINALQGTDPVELQVNYSTLPLIDENFISSIFPMTAIIDALVDSEEKIAEAIGNSNIHGLRKYLRGLSEGLVSGSPVPALDVAGNPLAGGQYGAVLDADDNTQICTKKTVPFVEGILRAPAIHLVQPYYYAYDGATIIHTRDLVTVEMCVYNREDQYDKYLFNQNMLLPDYLGPAIWQGAVAQLVRDDEFNPQAARYAGYFATTLASIPPVQEVVAA